MILVESVAVIISEVLSTAILVICTCLAVQSFSQSVLTISALRGLTHLVIMNCFGQISGAHANPVISLSVWWRGIMSLTKLVIYIGAQMFGAIMGHYAVGILLNKSPNDLTCIPQPKAGLDDLHIMIIEFFSSLFIVMCWCTLWKKENAKVEFSLAAAEAAVCLMSYPLTGAYTNTATFLAPMFFTSKQQHIYAYVGGQLSAGILAPSLWKYMQKFEALSWFF